MRDDELWFYYTGLKWRSTFKYIGKFPNGTHELIPGRDRDGGAICLAVLRRDGFISLDADDKVGTIETRPFRVTPGNLHVNADVFDGELRVEVLDNDGHVVAESKAVKGDDTQIAIEWERGSLADFTNKTVSLRFQVRNGRMYSYWLAE